MGRHLKRLNPEKSRRKTQDHEIISESCLWAYYAYPANPEPATAKVEAAQMEQKRAVA